MIWSRALSQLRFPLCCSHTQASALSVKGKVITNSFGLTRSSLFDIFVRATTLSFLGSVYQAFKQHPPPRGHMPMPWTHHLGKGDRNHDWHIPILKRRGVLGRQNQPRSTSFLEVLFLSWDVSNSDMSSVFVQDIEEEQL